jgi:hypothetical protein
MRQTLGDFVYSILSQSMIFLHTSPNSPKFKHFFDELMGIFTHAVDTIKPAGKLQPQHIR